MLLDAVGHVRITDFGLAANLPTLKRARDRRTGVEMDYEGRKEKEHEERDRSDVQTRDVKSEKQDSDNSKQTVGQKKEEKNGKDVQEVTEASMTDTDRHVRRTDEDRKTMSDKQTKKEGKERDNHAMKEGDLSRPLRTMCGSQEYMAPEMVAGNFPFPFFPFFSFSSIQRAHISCLFDT